MKRLHKSNESNKLKKSSKKSSQKSLKKTSQKTSQKSSKKSLKTTSQKQSKKSSQKSSQKSPHKSSKKTSKKPSKKMTTGKKKFIKTITMDHIKNVIIPYLYKLSQFIKEEKYESFFIYINNTNTENPRIIMSDIDFLNGLKERPNDFENTEFFRINVSVNIDSDVKKTTDLITINIYHIVLKSVDDIVDAESISEFIKHKYKIVWKADDFLMFKFYDEIIDLIVKYLVKLYPIKQKNKSSSPMNDEIRITEFMASIINKKLPFNINILGSLEGLDY